MRTLVKRVLARARPAVLPTLLGLASACGGTGAVTARPILPLRTLRLYETGVGYFERSGEVSASAGMSLPVPAGHLDDALKTLVVIDPSGKNSVHGVAWSSSVSHGMARALAGLPVEGEESLDLRQLLGGLKGAGVQVEARGATHQGRLIEVTAGDDRPAPAAKDSKDPKEAADGAAKDPGFSLLILTDAGAIVRVPSAAILAVRPLEGAWATRLGSALDALSSRGARSEKLLEVMGAGAGPVTLGYVAETPVWRTTYRLVLADDGKSGTLQGWALLHNDTDEDWARVRVELANGRPDSFLFPFAAPRYARRELVSPDERLATVPQLLGTTVDALWGDQVGDSFGSGGLSLQGVGEGGGGRGEGIGLGSIGTVGHGSGTGNGSSLLSVGNLAAVAPAVGAEAGALFIYTLPDRVDLRAHSSALVPFASQRVDAAPLAWFESPGSPGRSAVRFTNSTSQTLPPGTIAFFAAGGFAGEASLPRLLPGARRFVTYGLDLDVEVTADSTRAVDETKRLTWNKAAARLEEHYLRTSDLTYGLKNRGRTPREVVVAMAITPNATLTGPDRIDFDEASSHPVSIFDVAAGKSATRTVHAVEGLERVFPFASLDAARLLEMAASPSLDAADRVAATEAAARLAEAEEDATAEARTKADAGELEKDMERVRDEMKALPGERAGGAATSNPFAARLITAEDHLLVLRRRLATLESHEKGRREAAKTALSRLVRRPP